MAEIERATQWDQSANSPKHDRVSTDRCEGTTTDVIVTGIVLILIGLLLGVPIVYSIGILLLIVGVILLVLGSAGRAVGPRRHYW